MTQFPPVAGRIRSLSDLQPGDHVCGLFSSEPVQRTVVARFLCEGLERRQRVICLADSRSSDEIAESLRERGADPARAIEAGQLLDVLRTHPIAVIDGEVHENFFFVEPAESLGPDRASAILRSRLSARSPIGFPRWGPCSGR